MEQFWDIVGRTLTQFITGMADIWTWLTETKLWTWGTQTFTPLGLFGIGFGVLLGVIVVKELIF